MKTSLYGVCCVVLLWGSRVAALADTEYYEALARAEAAEQSNDLHAALHAFEAMQHAYPRDYTVTLRLGWAHFRLQQYAEAERAYRSASEVSHGAAPALIGLGWALIQQNRCKEATPILKRALARAPEQTQIDERARGGLAICDQREAIHGSAWMLLGGSIYTKHAWKNRSGDFSAGLSLAPYAWLRTAAAYRFLRLQANDPRVGSYDQHEVYAQAGYADARFSWLAHGAVIWSGSDVLGASRHIGLSGRVNLTGALLLDASASFYRDLWIARVAPAWEFYLGPVSLTPSFALQRLARETLGSASLTVSLVLQRFSIWTGGKFGSEYRAAYLPSFAVFNPEERSQWSLWAGLRVHLSEFIALLASYAFNRLKSADGLLSDLHNLGIGTVFTL